MRALQIESVGSPLVPVDLPDPTPGPGDVVVAVEAAGICRSDVHYRSGTRAVPRLPLVPGHEVAGTVDAVGEGADGGLLGQRVCIHYLVTCGACDRCESGAEQFCRTGAMVGLDRPGGYAERLVVPARNAHPIPGGTPTEAAAIMMCSTATSFHALRRGGLSSGERVAIFGAGGLGTSAIRLAAVMGASQIIAVDIDEGRLAAAEARGAVAVDAREDVERAVREIAPDGVDVALELVGDHDVMASALAVLGPGGRAVAVGITHGEFGLDPYRDLIGREVDIRGASDHLAAEIDELLALVAAGTLDLDGIVTASVPLEAGAVNDALDTLEAFGEGIRTVIVP